MLMKLTTDILNNWFNLFFNYILTIKMTPDPKTDEKDKNDSLSTELFKIVKEYSEYSTIAGFHNLFMTKQTRIGKIFWACTLFATMVFSLYW